MTGQSQLPTDAAKALRRRVYDKIDTCYDEVKRRYKPTLKGGRFTDQSIADDLHCPVELVIKLREEFFGPNTVPDEPEKLKEIQTDLAHLIKDATDMETLAKGLKMQAKSWQAQAEELRAKVDGLCAEFGWAP